jgi:hypothetical protein
MLCEKPSCRERPISVTGFAVAPAPTFSFRRVRQASASAASGVRMRNRPRSLSRRARRSNALSAVTSQSALRVARQFEKLLVVAILAARQAGADLGRRFRKQRDNGLVGGQCLLLPCFAQGEQGVSQDAAELAEAGLIAERQPLAAFDPRPQWREPAVGENIKRDQHIGVEHHAQRRRGRSKTGAEPCDSAPALRSGPAPVTWLSFVNPGGT